ncbi:two-component system histidine kinase PnpS [Marinilactibacillus psychrotolerans]|uniref:histidine kinase n=1 Tax=Marinilactibacillus psychrotolerans TaxID=191770 RepID=A0AAV3WV39_9LACT|nr:ATP-binding protein [Marinilactibacillus psychrotolerans]GEL67702.1 PAS domain-containing sensor histidine kinase [Marinilactibacillus psychrotolerans]GEQ36473.1 PAS domain-containing sensor histidine kinase [Marinilactibacillus psychrotolerans]SDD04368.1 two-component system, OmpR family, phosphate regulon sensor histidine kinase PhoR [Marinilactibacillus psychrotolerans]
MKQLRRRILLFFLILFGAFSIIFYYISSNTFIQQAMDQQGEDLQAQLLTLQSQVDGRVETQEDLPELNESLEETSALISERITLINLSGKVIFDSHVDQSSIENHFDRPEFQEVLEGEEIGTYDRVSSSTDDFRYYAAVPLQNTSGEQIGILRLSKKVEEMIGITDEIVRYLLVFITISLILTMLFTFYWTKRIGDPIEEIKFVANKLSQQKYKVRYKSTSYQEIDGLGQTVNELAGSLESQMQEIKQNDKRLRELINHLVIGVMLIDENRQITMVNPIMNEILEENLYGKIGHSYLEVFKSFGLNQLIEAAYEKQELQNREIALLIQAEKIVDVNIVPIPGRMKNTTNYIVLLYDITEIRRLEKVRTDFVANASHELRTPITALKGFSETLLDGALEDREVLIEFLEIMLKESSRLDLMVQDILQLSKLEQKQVRLNVEAIEAKVIVKEVFQILQQKAELKNIELSIEYDEPVYLEVDHDQLKQIILNLVGNAVSYTPENGIVKVELGYDNQEAVIKVVDNGIGIPQEEQSRVFERFYRVDKARSRNAGGTGLGLSIVKYLVENLNGFIELNSELGKGTSFEIHLPIKFENKQLTQK